jgi:hypothetical protein
MKDINISSSIDKRYQTPGTALEKRRVNEVEEADGSDAIAIATWHRRRRAMVICESDVTPIIL